MTRWFREVGDASLFPAGSVVAIGAFDGVHRGHAHLLALARARATELGLPAVALSFEPLPREFFAPDDPPARLTPARARFEGLRGADMDAVVALRFNRNLAAMSAPAFIDQVLLAGLSARVVCVGPGFRFGKARGGDVALLAEAGRKLGFRVEVVDAVDGEDGDRLGASAIRQALRRGDLLAAEAALGRPYAISGRVVRGQQLGRQLGFPTANIAIRWRPAVEGIFAVRVHGAGLSAWPGVASLGTRPTVGGVGTVLEAHLFDFNGDLYGQRLTVEFVERLRGEEKFDSLDALVAQMHADARQARAILDNPPSRPHLGLTGQTTTTTSTTNAT